MGVCPPKSCLCVVRMGMITIMWRLAGFPAISLLSVDVIDFVSRSMSLLVQLTLVMWFTRSICTICRMFVHIISMYRNCLTRYNLSSQD